MVVLAVTWMAKAGHDADVAPILAKLTAESRNEPGVLMFRYTGIRPSRGAFSSMSSIKMTPRSKPTAPRRTSCSTPAKTCPKLRTGWKAICSSHWGRLCGDSLCGAGTLRQAQGRLLLASHHEGGCVRLYIASAELISSPCRSSTRRPMHSFPSTLHGRRQ